MRGADRKKAPRKKGSFFTGASFGCTGVIRLPVPSEEYGTSSHPVRKEGGRS